MSETPINLNKARKSRARTVAKSRADANAARFGRTKAERMLEASESALARRRLDQQKFEDE